MSVQSEITRIESAKTAIATAIEGKGVTVPDGTKLDGMAALIDSIEAGGVGNYEVSTGIITLSEDAESLSFEHGLSKAPSFVHIFLPIGYSVATYSNTLRSYYKKADNFGNKVNNRDVYACRSSTSYVYHENSLWAGEQAFDINDATVTAPGCGFNSQDKRKWIAGNPYHWICIAGEVIFPYK